MGAKPVDVAKSGGDTMPSGFTSMNEKGQPDVAPEVGRIQ